MRVGFVGLGTMGRPMAVNLLKAGHELAVFDLDPAAVDALAVAGATVAGSAREAAAGREAVVTMQPWVEIDRSTYISEVGTRLRMAAAFGVGALWLSWFGAAGLALVPRTPVTDRPGRSAGV
ncbi:MAG: hypothetical protein E6I08_02040 [Chloroflexi bacterium]|nr:MAG: hypothetical protein E6I08_02040 [Chloroflexota bacterium]